MNTIQIAGFQRQYEFTVAVLSDTQNYSEKFPDVFHAQTRWLAENTARENIVFVTHVGDIVQHGGAEVEWAVAVPAMQRLVGTVPFGVVSGNHDNDVVGDPKAAMTHYRRRFGQEFFGKVPTAKGFGPEDGSSYHIFPAGGKRSILSLHLEHDPRDAALAWAQTVLDKHRNLPAMLTAHTYLNDLTDARDTKPYCRAGGNSPEDLFQKLVRKNPRLFLVQCGHWWTGGGETTQISTNDYGGRVIELLSDYQGRASGGDGWLRLLRFDPRNGFLHVQTYSPTLRRFETDADSEMTLPLEIDRPVAPAPIKLQRGPVAVTRR